MFFYFFYNNIKSINCEFNEYQIKDALQLSQKYHRNEYIIYEKLKLNLAK